MKKLTISILLLSFLAFDNVTLFAKMTKNSPMLPDSAEPKVYAALTTLNKTANDGPSADDEAATNAAIVLLESTILSNNLVCVDGGTFVMGCLEAQGDCWEAEKPAHPVEVKSFYLSKFEVTQLQWRLVMGKNPSYFKNCDDCPVEQVSWNDVQAFIAKLNAKTGKNYRLPTEAEWEFAAREGGKDVLFGNGKNMATADEMNFNAQAGVNKAYTASGNYRQTTMPVGSLSSNALGIHDMSGNVWEWCADSFQTYNEAISETSTSPVSSANLPPMAKAMRGGSWKNPATFCRTTCRGKEFQNKSNMLTGFRLALDK